MIEVEVIFAEPQRHHLIPLKLPAGSTLRQAIESSGIIQTLPEIDFAKCKLGIYGKIATANNVLSAHDRVEIYRPLKADPKEIRRQRAFAGGRSGKKPKP